MDVYACYCDILDVVTRRVLDACDMIMYDIVRMIMDT